MCIFSCCLISVCIRNFWWRRRYKQREKRKKKTFHFDFSFGRIERNRKRLEKQFRRKNYIYIQTHLSGDRKNENEKKNTNATDIKLNINSIMQRRWKMKPVKHRNMFIRLKLCVRCFCPLPFSNTSMNFILRSFIHCLSQHYSFDEIVLLQIIFENAKFLISLNRKTLNWLKSSITKIIRWIQIFIIRFGYCAVTQYPLKFGAHFQTLGMVQFT